MVIGFQPQPFARLSAVVGLTAELSVGPPLSELIPTTARSTQLSLTFKRIFESFLQLAAVQHGASKPVSSRFFFFFFFFSPWAIFYALALGSR